MDSPTASTFQHHFVCSACGKLHAPDESEYTCLACGPSGILEPTSSPYLDKYNGSEFEDFERGIGSALCPSPAHPASGAMSNSSASLSASHPPLLVSGTPLLHAEHLSQCLGLPHL